MTERNDQRVLSKRRKALEDEFFRKENERLAARLRADRAKREAREAIADVSGITDDAVLDRLVDLGIGAETVAALTLVPLVEVAWADGHMDDRERDAILAGASGTGIESGSSAYELLQQWLEERPSPRLLGAWRDYVGALCEEMVPAQRQKLKSEVLGRARHVAEAAGGFLGLGNKVSKEEENVFGILETAFKL